MTGITPCWLESPLPPWLNHVKSWLCKPKTVSISCLRFKTNELFGEHQALKFLVYGPRVNKSADLTQILRSLPQQRLRASVVSTSVAPSGATWRRSLRWLGNAQLQSYVAVLNRCSAWGWKMLELLVFEQKPWSHGGLQTNVAKKPIRWFLFGGKWPVWRAKSVEL